MDPLRFYDRLGKHYDLFEVAEAHAKARARQLVEQADGARLLNVGTGTGKEHARLQKMFRGRIFGLDRSAIMTRLSYGRAGGPLCQADSRRLPYASESLDVVYSAYVLDLLPLPDLPAILGEFWRVIRPGGRLLLLGLTEGTNLSSRALVKAWKTVYALSPLACGGCRPLQLSGLVRLAGFYLESREVIVQLGAPSEILLACKEISVAGV
jgi:demethylmenaquinone methyltransferase/2-methoxy-6-polyprenyl-1,4-benzoquinol methylase